MLIPRSSGFITLISNFSNLLPSKPSKLNTCRIYIIYNLYNIFDSVCTIPDHMYTIPAPVGAIPDFV